MEQERIGGIVLAGGKSSRMGQDKALLPHGDGRNLLEYCVEMLRWHVSSPDALVVVADRTDKYVVPGVPVIADLCPDIGPVGGIVTGLAHLGEGAHLVVACDMPRLHESVLGLLIVLAIRDKTLDAVVPFVDGRLEPLCAVYHHTALPKLEAFLVSGGRAAQKAVASLVALHVGENLLRHVDLELQSFANVNTPDDWQRYEDSFSP